MLIIERIKQKNNCYIKEILSDFQFLCSLKNVVSSGRPAEGVESQMERRVPTRGPTSLKDAQHRINIYNLDLDDQKGSSFFFTGHSRATRREFESK